MVPGQIRFAMSVIWKTLLQKKADTQSCTQLREVDERAYSNALNGGRNKRTMRNERNACAIFPMYLN